VDVGQEEAVEAGLEKALEDFGGAFSILVHNAGHGDGGGTMPGVGTHQWRGTLAVNLDAAFFLTRSLLRREGALPPGSSVVLIASGRGHGPAPGMAAYGTAKAGLIHFGALLAQDVGPRGVRVNVVSPGYIETADSGASQAERHAIAAHTALRRLGVPEDVAGVVLFFRLGPFGFRHASAPSLRRGQPD
jgi:NAD(P)-dependent dehydrogenase (short-subunit alcohol dehydrogenase family)